MPRNLQAFYLGDEALTRYFLPPTPDARFVSAHYDVPCRALVTVFEHESYMPVYDGCLIPRYPMPEPEQPLAWLARLLSLDESQARDWLIAKVAAFRSLSEAEIEEFL